MRSDIVRLDDMDRADVHGREKKVIRMVKGASLVRGISVPPRIDYVLEGGVLRSVCSLRLDRKQTLRRSPIMMDLPVRGLRLTRDLVVFVVNMPKSRISTLSPARRLRIMISKSVSTMCVASCCESSNLFDNLLISSDFFMTLLI